MPCFRTGRESLHRIALVSDVRTTPSDSLSFSLLPRLVPSQLLFPLVPLLSYPTAMQAGAAHFCFLWAPSFQLHTLCVPQPGLVPAAQYPSIINLQFFLLHNFFSHHLKFITSEKALARKVSEGSYQLVIHFIMYFGNSLFFNSHLCLPEKVCGESANVE